MGGVSCTPPQAPVDPTKYTITFDSQGGSEVAAQEVAENVAATAPEAPTKDGYTFVEWLSGDAAYDWTAPVTGNLTLTAKWTPAEYKITYLPEGVETDNPTTYTIETETFALKAPTKAPDATKPNFVAWHVDSEEGDVVTEIAKGTTGDLTIVAEFSAKTVYVVTYYIGETKKTQNVEEGKSFSLTGYDLFTDKEFKTAYTAKEVTANIELYAKAKKMTVKFDSDGGSAVADAEVDYNTVVAKPTDPTLDGSTFQGWILDGKAYDFNAKVTKDITLKATWKANAAEEPTTPPAGEEETLLPTTFKIGETYSGTVTYPMKDNLKEDGTSWGNAIGDLMLNFDLTGQTLKAKDTVKVSFKITESSSDKIKNFGYNSAFDWGTYNSIDAKELGSVYTLSFTVGTKTTFENNLCGFKINPADGEGELKGKDLVLKIEEFTVTLVPYVEGAEKLEVVFDSFTPYSSSISRSDLQKWADSSTGDAKLLFHYKFNDGYSPVAYDGVGVVHGWRDPIEGTDEKGWQNDASFNNKVVLNLGSDVTSNEGIIEINIADILEYETVVAISADPWATSDAEGAPKKITITKVEVKYTAK